MELVRVGRNPDELAEEFEPSAQAIRNWVKQADLDQGVRSDGLTTEERDELQRLRRENKQLKMEREILKKGQGQREMSNKHKSPGGYGIYMRVLAAFPFLMGACVGEPHDTPLADASYGQGVCGDAAPATSLGAVAMVGSSPHVDSLQIGHPAGLALIDSTVYVLDGAEPTIRFFDSDLNYLGRFVGRGGGPGEMLQFRTGSAVPDYLAVAGEQLVVLDYSGDQTLSFSADGKPRQVLTRNHTQYGWRAHTHKRMRWSTDTLFFGGGSYYPIIPPGTKERPVFHVRAVSGGKARTLAMLPVHAVPRTPSGAFMVGPAEAVAVWEITTDCILINDGHSSTIHIWTRNTGRRHDLQFELPDDMEPAYTFGDSPFPPNRQFSQGIRFPEPNLPRQISDMTMAPDGIIWIELAPSARRAERKIIVRLQPDGSAQRVDTLPAFPKVFMQDGTWYGLGYLEDETAVVWKGRQEHR